MAGLIDSGITTTKKAPNPFDLSSTIDQAKPFGYNPTLSTVNTKTDTVSAQLDAILGKDSPTIQRARSGAQQWANSRGLLNSTMAGQAGEAAAIDAALPIAQQDAATLSTQRLMNQQDANAADQFGAAAANNASIFNAGESNKITGQKVAGQIETGLIGSRTAASKELAAQEAGLQANTIIPAQTKSQLAVQGQQIQGQKTLAQMDIESRAALQKMQNDTTLSVADKQAAQSKFNAELAARTQTQMQAVDNAFKMAYQAADAASKTELQKIDNATKTELANIQANYQTVMQTSASATSTFNTSMTMIANTIADSSINATDKAKLINGYLGWMKQEMNVIGNVNGVDVGDLLNFSTVSA